ncbi:MAG: tRNA adenosine(34) deaminase TadA [Acidobacteria bacterium]|nr:tRNA adenosine(34) deaminase TadA [Acidobacteriota bacterium]
MGAEKAKIPLVTERDEYWMGIALEQSRLASSLDEVPVGACVVSVEGELLAAASNRTITDNDPTAHAEVLAIRAAAKRIGNYRLTGATVYTTIEPCVMCAGTLVNARVRRLVFGAPDERYGAVVTHFRVCDSPLLNHRIEITSGIRIEECRSLMKDFFRKKRLAT